MNREIDVYMEGQVGLVGRLTSDMRGTLTFQYDSGSARELSISLPLREEPYAGLQTEFFFENLLPENDQMRETMRNHNIKRDDVAGLLYHYGGDCAGAISCVPKGEAPGKAPGRLDEDYERLSEEDLEKIAASLRDRKILPSSTRNPSPVAGFQGKIALACLSDGGFALPKEGSGAPTTHILKVPEKGQEALVDREHCLMSIAADVYSDDVARTETIDIGSVRGLLVERFDRHVENGVVSRIHQEDFCQALGIPREFKYQRDGKPGRIFSAKAVRQVLSRSATPATARLRFLEATLLNLALGNTDNHAKNHALLYRGGAPDFAPLYDIVPVLLDRTVSHEFSISIGNAETFDDLVQMDLYQFAEGIGVPVERKAAKEQARKLASDLFGRVAGELGRCSGPRLGLVGDMIADCLERMNEAYELGVEVPERDAFLIRGGAFDILS